MNHTSGPMAVGDLVNQREDAVIRAVKKAWKTAREMNVASDVSAEIAIYLLGAAGHTDGVLLGYDFTELADFLGGVVDGDFSELPTGSAADLTDSVGIDASAADWVVAPLPARYVPQQFTQAFAAVQDALVWQAFGGDGGPAWARVVFRLDEGTVTASAEPVLTLAEIRAIAQLPHPPPRAAVVRGYLAVGEIASGVGPPVSR